MTAKIRHLLTALVCGVVSSLVASLRPLLIASLTTEEHWTILLPSFRSFPLVGEFLNFQLLIFLELIDFCLLFLSGVYLAKFSSSYALDLRLKLNKNTVLAMSQGETETLSRFTSYLKTYVETVEEYLKTSIVPSVTALLTIIGSLYFTTQIQSSISILIGCEILILFVMTLIYGHVFAKLAHLRFKADELMLDNASVDVKKGIAIWFSGIGSLWIKHRALDVRVVAATRSKIGQLEALYFNGMVLVIGLFLCFGYVVLVKWQSLPPITFLAYALYAGLIMGPVARFCAFFPETRQYLIAISALKNNPPDPENIQLAREITISASDFINGKTSSDPVLIETGDRVFIGGASGSGKTSILYALVGLRSGVFRSVSINNFEPNVLAPILPTLRFFYLSETPAFEKGTVIGSLPTSEKDTVTLIQKYKIFDFQEESEMSSFLNRQIDAAGLPLSLGERQRLQLVRALILSPRILMLDEALSGVSENVEREIVQRLIDASDIDILIYVSHRSGIQTLFPKSIIVERK